jgi:LPXTG-motif cell wall-anchored protein
MKNIFILPVILIAITPVVFANTGATTTTTVVSTGATVPAAAAEALNVPGAPELVSKTDTTITLKWNKVAAAKTYIVKYSKKSVAEAANAGDTSAMYQDEIDPVTTTGATIKNLKANTPYFFAVVALDEKNNESATNSEELSVSTLPEGAGTTSTAGTTEQSAEVAKTSDFKLANVVVVDDRNLNVSFSTPVAIESVTLKLTKSANSSNIPVLTVSKGTNPLEVSVKLGAALDPTSSYSLVVVTAKAVSGSAITQWLNAVKEFSTVATLQKAATAGTLTVVGGNVASGATVSGNTSVNGLNSAPATASGALAANQLPTTGTKENLLLALAALLGLAIAYAIRTRKA